MDELTRTKIELIEAQQELATLKEEIKRALKPELEDLQKSMNKEYNNDLCEAYKYSLKRTFKVLKRLGINL